MEILLAFVGIAILFAITEGVIRALEDWLPSLSNEAKNRVRKIKALAIVRADIDRQLVEELGKTSRFHKRKILRELKEAE